MQPPAWNIGLLVGLLTVAAGLAAAFLWNWRKLELTRLRLAEAQVRRLLVERIAHLSQHANDIILLMDREWRILEANERATQAYGRSLEALQQLDLPALRTPETQAESKWQMEILDTPNGTRMECQHQRRDGTAFPVECHLWRIELAGQPYHQAIIRDLSEVTDRKRAEAALEESEARLRRAVEDAPVPILVHDEEDRVLQLSQGWTRYSGYTLADLPTMGDWTERAYGARSASAKDYIDRLFAINETTHNGIWEIKAKDGSTRLWDFQTTPLGRVSGGKRVLLSLAVDVTEWKRAELELQRLNAELEQRVRDRTAELAAANQELEAFSYSVSHDLRAPLRHIDGFVALLAEQGAARLDDQSRQYLATINTAVRRMGRLIDDLLVFSRMGRTALQPTTVDLETLARRIIRELEPDARGRNIIWEVHPLPPVQADPAMLRLVLLNLFGNAIKYTRPREPARIKVAGTANPDGEVVVCVRDNGVGFDPRYADKLFGVFQRLHRADEFEGTGIGLANVRRIIQRHGGRTWAEGAMDAGARFYFSLPQARKPAAPLSGETTAKPPPAKGWVPSGREGPGA